MNKTNPIGVRFRADLLEKLKNEHGIESPQKALVFYERFFVTWSHLGKDIKFPLRSPAPISADQAAALHNAENKGQSTKAYNIPKKKAEELLKPIANSGFEAAISEAAQKQIREDIARIKAERCPPERDTPIGRKSWQIDQQKRIKELQDKLA